MSGQKRLFLTTLSDAARGMAEEIDPNIATCYHFNGLMYRYSDDDPQYNDEVTFYQDLVRLAGILREEGSPVVVLGAWHDFVPQTVFDIAQFLFRNTDVGMVITFTRQQRQMDFMDFQIYGITKHGLSLIKSSREHRTDLWKVLLANSRRLYDKVTKEENAA